MLVPNQTPSPEDMPSEQMSQEPLPLTHNDSDARPVRTTTEPKNGNGGNLGFERALWAAAGKLRNNMDEATSMWYSASSS
jgi:hypothetical protein